MSDVHASPEPLSDLAEILAAISVVRRPGVFAVCSVDEIPDADVEAVVFEEEGITVVLPLDQAMERRLAWGFEAAWLTVEVRTSLGGVGLTAAFSRALADVGIPCNVLAGYHHDHVLVPAADADRAVHAVESLRR